MSGKAHSETIESAVQCESWRKRDSCRHFMLTQTVHSACALSAVSVTNQPLTFDLSAVSETMFLIPFAEGALREAS